MRKKILLLASVAALAMISIIGCGSKSGTESTASAEIDYNVDDYVTLGDYKNLVVEYPGKFEVTDEEVEDEITGILESKATYDEITDRKDVKSGDFVNLDYKGTVDGVEFDGGTATSQDIEIGSGLMIPGFEDALIGKIVGEESTIKVTFPEGYSEELSGKEAEFAVKINSIKKKIIPELTDEFVKENSDLSTVADYKAELKKSLQEQRDEDVNNYKLYFAYSMAVDNATIKGYPESLLNKYIDDYKKAVQEEVDEGSLSYEEYITQYYNMSVEDFDKTLTEYIQNVVGEQMVVEAVSKAEKLDLTDKQFKEKCEEYASENGFESVDKLLETYYEDDLRNYFRIIAVRDFIGDSAKIVEAEESTAQE